MTENDQPARSGDEVESGTAQSAENTCPACGGSGRTASGPCSECDGTGLVTVIVGDA